MQKAPSPLPPLLHPLKRYTQFYTAIFMYTFTRSSASSPMQDLSNVPAVKHPEKPPSTTPSQKPSATGLTHYPHSYAFGAKRRMFDKGPDVSVFNCYNTSIINLW